MNAIQGWSAKGGRESDILLSQDIGREVCYALSDGMEFPLDRIKTVFETYNAFIIKCESPIEELMLSQLVWLEEAVDTRGIKIQVSLSSQVHVENKGGAKYRADFMLDVSAQNTRGGGKRKIAVECDGHNYHERTREQARRDRSRDRDMAALGITVLRFTSDEIFESPRKCFDSVHAHLVATFEQILGPPPAEGGQSEDGRTA